MEIRGLRVVELMFLHENSEHNKRSQHLDMHSLSLHRLLPAAQPNGTRVKLANSTLKPCNNVCVLHLLNLKT